MHFNKSRRHDNVTNALGVTGQTDLKWGKWSVLEMLKQLKIWVRQLAIFYQISITPPTNLKKKKKGTFVSKLICHIFFLDFGEKKRSGSDMKKGTSVPIEASKSNFPPFWQTRRPTTRPNDRTSDRPTDGQFIGKLQFQSTVYQRNSFIYN